MNLESFFLVLLQVAVAIIGFSGIVLALLVNAQGISKETKEAFNITLASPLVIMAYSSLALVIYSSSVDLAAASQILSGIMIVVILAILPYRMRVKNLNSAYPTTVGKIASVLMLAQIIILAANIIWLKHPLAFVAFCLVNTFQTLLVFSGFLWKVWQNA